MVVRYQGGDNAGHTVVVGDETLKLQLCPSGVLYPHITSVIGNGVVVNPATLIAELDMLMAKGIDVSRVRVSRSAHVIMPYHVALDRANEVRLGGAKVGTTGRGIGPAYGDRAWRLGLRMEDLCDREVLRDRIGARAARQEPAARRHGRGRLHGRRAGRAGGGLGRPPGAAPRRHDVARPGRAAARRPRAARGRPGHAARPRPRQLPVRDLVEPGRRRRLHRRRHRPAAGRRGHRRDEGLLHAGGRRVRSPPSCSTTSARASRSAGREFGTVTGRPRRVGWFDAVPMRYAVAVNSNTAVVLNKLDILSGIETIRAVRGLRDRRPARGRLAVERQRALAGDADLRGLPGLGAADPRRPQPVRPAGERPPLRVGPRGRTRGVPIVFVSVGPERTQTIERAWRPKRHRPAATA